MPRPLKPCGTDAAYQRHLRHGEQPCTACREASFALRRVAAGPERAARYAARGRARRAVAVRYPDEYRQLLDQLHDTQLATQAIVRLHADEYRALAMAELSKLTFGAEAPDAQL